MRAGELCLAIGNPLGRYPETVTIGVVSGLARTAVAGPGRPHYHLLQTDCDIHEGNSGGPLVDVRGRVIGVTTLLDSESPHIGLAIPMTTVIEVLPDLLAHGQVARATIGVSVVRAARGRSTGKELAGLEVTRLTRQRGQKLRPGDFILRVARQPVPDPPSLFALLGGERIGKPTTRRADPPRPARRGRRAALAPRRLTPCDVRARGGPTRQAELQIRRGSIQNHSSAARIGERGGDVQRRLPADQRLPATASRSATAGRRRCSPCS